MQTAGIHYCRFGRVKAHVCRKEKGGKKREKPTKRNAVVASELLLGE